MTERYPSASTVLPTSLAMVFMASKSLLEAAGKPASIMSTSSLASYRAMSRCDWGCNWGGGGGKVWVWEWSLMGRNMEWETERQSGSEGERTEMRDRDEREERQR